MMRTRSIAGVTVWRWLVLLAAIVVLAVAFVVASGPSPAVATVDGKTISLATYRDWLTAAAVSVHASDSAVPPFVPDAPGYTRCIAFERAAASKSKSTVPSDATLRTDCGDIRTTLAEEVMQFLLGGQWFLDEGAREGVTLSAAQVRETVHAAAGKTTGLTALIRSRGLSQSELEFEARAALLAGKLSAAHSGPTPTITSAQIASYYAQNRSTIGSETLAQATPAIRQTLIQAAQAPTYDAWMSKVQKYFRPRTECEPGYRIAYYCRAPSR